MGIAVVRSHQSDDYYTSHCMNIWYYELVNPSSKLMIESSSHLPYFDNPGGSILLVFISVSETCHRWFEKAIHLVATGL